MAHRQFRVFFGSAETDSAEFVPLATSNAVDPNRVTVPLGNILESLVHAANSGRAWLDDFSDDRVSISADLYDVLQASRHYRRTG